MSERQLCGTAAAIAQDRERIAQLRADEELRNGRKLPPPLPQTENGWTSHPGGCVKDDVEWNLEKSSRESERESELLAWCDDLKEVCANKDETIAGLRSALDRVHALRTDCVKRNGELQKTIDEQDSQIESLFQQLQEVDNRPY